jgi:hypothetical protein
MAVSADIRMNSGDYNWTYNPNDDPACDPALPPDPQRWRYDVESVLTHEVGHVFGLVNLSEAEDINQTMFPGIKTLQWTHAHPRPRRRARNARALRSPLSSPPGEL